MQAMEVLDHIIAAKRVDESKILVPILLISWLLILVIHTMFFYNHNLPRIRDD